GDNGRWRTVRQIIVEIVMSQSLTERKRMLLQTSLQQAAMPADRQLAHFRGFDVPFEVADDICKWCRWGLDSSEMQLTDEQRAPLAALYDRLLQMSGSENAELWTDDALRTRPEWEDVRQQARTLLD